LRLFDGIIQVYSNADNRISEVAFNTYDLNLSPYGSKESKHIYSDELSTSEIIYNLKQKKTKDFTKYEKEQFAALHSRIINPFYIFFYSLLPLLMIRFSKRPDDSWLYPISAVSIVAFISQILQITLSNLLIENSQIIYFNYFFPFLLTASVLAYLNQEIFDIFRKNYV